MFFVGGAPRSGTTWLQHVLNAHPEISCEGEGLFMQQLATPIDRALAARNQEIAGKNTNLFSHFGGYTLSPQTDADFLLGSGILLAFERQLAKKTVRVVGEKTPENVFLFPRLKTIFPHCKFIGIARDPRDVMTSSWHFFQKTSINGDEEATKLGFIKVALPALKSGMRAILDLPKQYPGAAMMLTYESMRAEPAKVAAQLYRFLGVSDAPEIVADCVARTSFAALSGGRKAGEEKNGSFFRKGLTGTWQDTLSPEMNQLLLDETGPMFQEYGW